MDFDDMKNKAKDAWEDAKDAVTGDDHHHHGHDAGDHAHHAADEAKDEAGDVARGAENVKDDVVGKAKEKVGDWTDNTSMEMEGKAQQAEANVRRAGESVSEAVEG